MKKIHLIAIGGAVMHNLALELHQLGHEVSGSDDTIFEPALSRLRSAGILPNKTGWDASKITSNIDLIILGMHAKKDNVELARALELQIPVMSFPEFIAMHAADKQRWVVAGSHGKTTTTAMTMHALKANNINFDYLVGAALDGFENMVRLSDAPIMVIEGDEYGSSALNPKPKFFHYKPHAAVITGIAWDHINIFKSFSEYVEQFNKFTQTFMPSSPLFIHESLQSEPLFQSHVPATIYQQFDYVEKEGNTYVYYNNELYPVQFFGYYNFQNLKAAYRLCELAGISAHDFLTSMATFKGTQKRQEVLVNTQNKVIIRDFAHSPSKVKATVNAVVEKYPHSKTVAILELHTYSSLDPEFIPLYKGTCSNASNLIVFLDEEALQIKNKSMPSSTLLNEVFNNPQICTSKKELEVLCRNWVLEHKPIVLLFMSSGNFAQLPIETF